MEEPAYFRLGTCSYSLYVAKSEKSVAQSCCLTAKVLARRRFSVPDDVRRLLSLSPATTVLIVYRSAALAYLPAETTHSTFHSPSGHFQAIGGLALRVAHRRVKNDFAHHRIRNFVYRSH